MSLENKIQVARTRGIEYVLQNLPYSEFQTVLDLGIGDGFASEYMSNRGKTVTGLGMNLHDYGLDADSLSEKGISLIEDNFFDYDFCGRKFDAVWASHIMEHTTNAGLFLDKISSILPPDGYLFVSVPPFKTNIVGGHVNTGWTLGQLAYVLILHNFDARSGQFLKYGYNLTAFVRKSHRREIPEIKFDRGDIELLRDYFPEALRASQNSEGDVYQINWPSNIDKKEKRYRLKTQLAKIKKEVNYLLTNIKQYW